MEENGAPTLYVKTDDTGDYQEYTPPEPPAFHETLPEDLRDSEHLKEVDGADKLARYYVDLKSNYLKPPDTADGYEFEKPDGFDLDSDTFSKFKNIAFENGVNQKQFEEIMKLEVDRHKQAQETMQKNIETAQVEAEKALKAEWGDQYEKRLESAQGFLRHESISSESFNKFLEETRFGDNPEVIRMFSKLSDLISEDGFVKPGKGSEQDGSERDEAGRPMLKFPSMEE